MQVALYLLVFIILKSRFPRKSFLKKILESDFTLEISYYLIINILFICLFFVFEFNLCLIINFYNVYMIW